MLQGEAGLIVPFAIRCGGGNRITYSQKIWTTHKRIACSIEDDAGRFSIQGGRRPELHGVLGKRREECDTPHHYENSRSSTHKPFRAVPLNLIYLFLIRSLFLP